MGWEGGGEARATHRGFADGGAGIKYFDPFMRTTRRILGPVPHTLSHTHIHRKDGCGSGVGGSVLARWLQHASSMYGPGRACVQEGVTCAQACVHVCVMAYIHRVRHGLHPSCVQA